MIYLYQCNDCMKIKEVEKSMIHHARVEKCKKCGKVMARIYTAPSIKTGDGFK